MSNTTVAGACTDRSLGVNYTAADAAAAALTEKQTCNTYTTKEKCIAQVQCMWRNEGDYCFCTFDGCSCSNPVGAWNGSATFSRTSMAMVLFPTFSLIICVCAAGFSYVYRKRVTRALIAICPGSVIEKLSYKDTLDVEEKIPEVVTEMPEDSDEEGADPTKKSDKKKKKKDKRQEKREYRGEWMLTVVVERAQNLPRLDSTFRDPSLIGYSGQRCRARARIGDCPQKREHGGVVPFAPTEGA